LELKRIKKKFKPKVLLFRERNILEEEFVAERKENKGKFKDLTFILHKLVRLVDSSSLVVRTSNKLDDAQTARLGLSGGEGPSTGRYLIDLRLYLLYKMKISISPRA
jgi:hypothetical protein